ncbi:MAG: outer membrane protein assembly factor BamE [Oligoflexia bacterium]|nr:outer membrane protein assembly factor BamE [Oligoflexia bacterium]
MKKNFALKNLFFLFSLLLVTLVITLSGCANVGKNFTYNGPTDIELKKTTKNEILNKFGSPFRVGYNNGDIQWTYSYYQYSAFADTNTKDLIVSFNKDGIVDHYEYNSSFEDDKVKILANSSK